MRSNLLPSIHQIRICMGPHLTTDFILTRFYRLASVYIQLFLTVYPTSLNGNLNCIARFLNLSHYMDVLSLQGRHTIQHVNVSLNHSSVISFISEF